MREQTINRHVTEITKATAWLKETLLACRYAVNANAFAEYERQCQAAYAAFESGKPAPVLTPLKSILGLPDTLVENLIGLARNDGVVVHRVGEVYRRNLEGDLLSPWELSRYFVSTSNDLLDVESIPLSATEEDASVIAALAWARVNRDCEHAA